MRATRFGKEQLVKEFPFLTDVPLDELEADEEVRMREADDDLLSRTLYERTYSCGTGSSWSKEMGWAVTNEGQLVPLDRSERHEFATGSRRSLTADTIGAQIADMEVDYVVIYESHNTGTWDDAATERSITIYKMSSYDLTDWARRRRMEALQAMEAEMRAATTVKSWGEMEE